MIALLKLYFRLAGSWTTFLLITGAFVFLSVLLTVLVLRLTGNDPGETYRTMGLLMAVLSPLVMLLFAPQAVRSAMQRDYQQELIDSHRLAPISNVELILGMVLGPLLQPLHLFAMIVVAGSLYASLATGSFNAPHALNEWWTLQLLTLTTSILLCTLVAVFTITARGKAGFVLPLMIGLAIFIWFIVMFVPAIGFILPFWAAAAAGANFIPWGRIFMGPVPSPETLVGVTLIVQALLTGLLLLAGARKIRRTERPVIGLSLGMTLLVVLGTLFAFAPEILVRALGPWNTPMFEDDMLLAVPIASVGVLMLLGQPLLVAGADRQTRANRTAHLTGDPGLRQHGTAGLLAPLALGLLCAAVAAVPALTWPDLLDSLSTASPPGGTPRGSSMYVYGPNPLPALFWDDLWIGLAFVTIAMLLSAWTEYQWMRFAVGSGTSVLWMTFVSIVLLKLLPLIIAAGAWGAAEGPLTPTEEQRVLAPRMFSPLGTLAICQDGYPWTVWPGLVFQAAVAGGVTWLASRQARNWRPTRSKAATETAPPTPAATAP